LKEEGRRKKEEGRSDIVIRLHRHDLTTENAEEDQRDE